MMGKKGGSTPTMIMAATEVEFSLRTNKAASSETLVDQSLRCVKSLRGDTPDWDREIPGCHVRGCHENKLVAADGNNESPTSKRSL
jgi:hypothetical protein